MNWLHRRLCRSHHWRKTVQQRVPWVLADRSLGTHVLELGPGPGLTTDELRRSIERLTVLELDVDLAQSLRTRMKSKNVDVVTADATAMPFPDGQFTGGACFTMLHHLPSPELQNRLLREMRRVLKPGGIFVGCDSRQSLLMKLIHIGDTLVPIDPDTFGTRLQAAGFEVLELEKGPDAFRFQARRPAT